MKSKSSRIITNQSEAKKDCEVIGTKLSTIGSDQITAPSQTIDEELETYLPQSVQQALASQVDRDYELTGYQMTKEVSQQDKDTAIKMLDKALEPLPTNTILQELTRLKLKTMARNMTTEELSLQLAVYVDELSSYPADIVVKVLRDWPKQSKWWPTWHELDVELGWRTNRRQYKLDALIKGASKASAKYNEIINQAMKRI